MHKYPLRLLLYCTAMDFFQGMKSAHQLLRSLGALGNKHPKQTDAASAITGSAKQAVSTVTSAVTPIGTALAALPVGPR